MAKSGLLCDPEQDKVFVHWCLCLENDKHISKVNWRFKCSSAKERAWYTARHFTFIKYSTCHPHTIIITSW